MKIEKLLKTTQTIILSRIKKPNTTIEDMVECKRTICKTCEYNSLNMEYIPPLKVVLKSLSYFYSWICGRASQDTLGNCTACESCSIFFKTEDEEHCPHPSGDKWKSIYKPNNAQKEKWKLN